MEKKQESEIQRVLGRPLVFTAKIENMASDFLDMTPQERESAIGLISTKAIMSGMHNFEMMQFLIGVTVILKNIVEPKACPPKKS